MSHINGPSQASSSSTRLIPQFSTKELRPRVVEILSHTANGCLSELGYFPGMAQRLQEMEGTAAKWQQENIKLFADNRTLSIAYSNATAILKLQGKDAWLLEYQRLQSELQAARNEMAALIKDRTAMQQRITALSSGEEMQELLKNHENMRRMFAQLWEENKELKKRPMPVAHQIPVPSEPSINAIVQRFAYTDLISHDEDNHHQHRRSSSHREPATNQQFIHPSRQLVHHVPVPIPPQPVVPSNGRQMLTITAPPPPPMASLASPPSSHNGALTINTQMHATSKHPPYTPITPSQSAPQPPPSHPSQHYRPELYTAWPGPPPPPPPPASAHPSSHYNPQTVDAPSTSRRASWHHPPPTNPNSNSLRHAISTSPVPIAQSIPSSGIARLSPLSDIGRRSVSETGSHRGRISEQPSSGASSRRTSSSFSPEEAHEALTPISPPTPSRGSPKNSLLLKRSSIDMASPEDGVIMGEISRKRPKIETSPTVLAEVKIPESPMVEAIAGVEQMAVRDSPTVHSEAEVVKQEIVAEPEEMMQVDAPEAEAVTNESAGADDPVDTGDVEDSSDDAESGEPVERPLEDRVAELTYQDDDGVLTTCYLCMRRYSKGSIQEQPKPWVNATLEVVVPHFETLHPTAWEKTRTLPA